MARYYDSNLDNFVDVQTDEALALMRGKHLGSRTVLMSVHIVNKESGQETIVNDYGQLWRDGANLSETEELLDLEYDAEIINEQDIELGEDDDFALGDDDVDENEYPDVAADPGRMARREYLVDPNFEPDYGTDSDEEAEDEEMGSKYDDEDEDRPIIHFDKDNPTIDEGTIFQSVEDCRYAIATYAIKVGFEYITEKSDQKRLSVHCRETKVYKWRLHASPMRGGYPFQVAISYSSLFSYFIFPKCC